MSPDLIRDGFHVLAGIYSANECRSIIDELTASLQSRRGDAGTLQRASGVIYGARNLLELFPAARELWRRQPLVDMLTAALGPRFGLVRGLYFDKPPQSTWSLPWHQDRTIAVVDNTISSPRFKSPTLKAGVPHIEAPDEVLEQMLTLRIHVDEVTDENGPLIVLPGSHRGAGLQPALKLEGQVKNLPHALHASAGDVLAMRPLLYHCSGSSLPETPRHRRILHLGLRHRRSFRTDLPGTFSLEWSVDLIGAGLRHTLFSGAFPMDFTAQQLQAIDSGIPVPVNIEGRDCVVVPGMLFERFREAIEEWHPASMQRHMAQVMADDWSDPALDIYNE